MQLRKVRISGRGGAFVRALRTAIQASGKTYRQVAKESGIKHGTLAGYATGNVIASKEASKALSAALGTKLPMKGLKNGRPLSEPQAKRPNPGIHLDDLASRKLVLILQIAKAKLSDATIVGLSDLVTEFDGA